MLLCDKEIQELVDSKQVEITPWRLERLKGTSYDLSVGSQALVSNSDQKLLLDAAHSLRLSAGDFALILTREKVRLPMNVSGVIGMRSFLARKGLILLAGLEIDAGFRGHLRFGLYNASPRTVTLDYDDPLCSVEFHRLAGNVDHAAPVIQELDEGRLPEADVAFLRQLETTSLSDLSENVRALSQNVAVLTKMMWWFVVPILAATFAGVVTAVIATLLK